MTAAMEMPLSQRAGVGQFPMPPQEEQARAALAYVIGLLQPINDWCGRHSDRVSACHFDTAPDGLVLFIIGRSEKYDFELSRELADFMVALVDKGYPVFARLVPARSREFISTPGQLIITYG